MTTRIESPGAIVIQPGTIVPGRARGRKRSDIHRLAKRHLHQLRNARRNILR